VAILKRRQAEGIVLPFVFFVADADEGGFQEPDNGGHDLVACELLVLQVTGHTAADSGQGFRESRHAIVLRFVARLSPLRMIAVLLSATSVAPDGLEMSLRYGTDPYFPPRRRNCETLDPPERLCIPDNVTVRIEITKGFVRSNSAETRRCV
jgi:hypothetical protein